LKKERAKMHARQSHKAKVSSQQKNLRYRVRRFRKNAVFLKGPRHEDREIKKRLSKSCAIKGKHTRLMERLLEAEKRDKKSMGRNNGGEAPTVSVNPRKRKME